MYLKEYCKKFFLLNPDISTNLALEQLAEKFRIKYESKEMETLFNCIKSGKQYAYDNKELLYKWIYNIYIYINFKKI